MSGSTGSSGGRSDNTRSTAVWRFHSRSEPSQLRCVVCDMRTSYRIRRQSGTIEVRCPEHFAAITPYSEVDILRLPTTGETAALLSHRPAIAAGAEIETETAQAAESELPMATQDVNIDPATETEQRILPDERIEAEFRERIPYFVVSSSGGRNGAVVHAPLAIRENEAGDVPGLPRPLCGQAVFNQRESKWRQKDLAVYPRGYPTFCEKCKRKLGMVEGGEQSDG